MSLTIQDQSADVAAIAVHLCTASEVKYCSNCQNELTAQDQVRRTSFGLILCEDCLYS